MKTTHEIKRILQQRKGQNFGQTRKERKKDQVKQTGESKAKLDATSKCSIVNRKS
jgi:hypothetical protein